MRERAFMRMALVTTTALVLAGCQLGGAKTAETPDGTPSAAIPARSVKLVDRDVEAPDVFQVTDQALWDGRPSLGGVWVASDKTTDPERVILRNPANGKFVIGALFRREAFNPGPPLQISSDAAAALGMVAGQPATVSVTALRREEVPVEAPDATKPILDANSGVTTTPLDAPKDGAKPAATAPAPAVPKAPAPLPAAPAAKPAPAAPAAQAAAPTPAPAAAGGAVIQIGIFSVEANAKRAADTLKAAGISATVKAESAQGKSFWSVTATGSGDRKALLDKVKGLGFKDAYFLKR